MVLGIILTVLLSELGGDGEGKQEEEHGTQDETREELGRALIAARDPTAARPTRRPEPVSALFYPAKPTSVNTWRRNPPGQWARRSRVSNRGVHG